MNQTDPTAALRDRIAEALMRWAEGNNSPQYASMRRPETVRQNASGRAAAVLAELKPELDAIARVRDACDRLHRSAVLADGQPHTDRERGIVQAVTRIMAAFDGELAVEAHDTGTQQQGAAEAAPREWCKCRSCWGWFVEDHPGEDLDELGKDLGWWAGLPEHRGEPAPVAQQPAAVHTGGNAEDCPACIADGLNKLGYPWICPEGEQPAADTCRPFEVDGEIVSVRGSGDFTEQERQFAAEIIRAAKRKYKAEHGEQQAAAADDEETCGKTRSVDGSTYRPCARPARHPEAYCRSADGNHLFLAPDAPRP